MDYRNRVLYTVADLKENRSYIFTTQTDAAKQAGISVDTLQRHFKKVSLFTIHTFIIGVTQGIIINEARSRIGKRVIRRLGPPWSRNNPDDNSE